MSWSKRHCHHPHTAHTNSSRVISSAGAAVVVVTGRATWVRPSDFDGSIDTDPCGHWHHRRRLDHLYTQEEEEGEEEKKRNTRCCRSRSVRVWPRMRERPINWPGCSVAPPRHRPVIDPVGPVVEAVRHGEWQSIIFMVPVVMAIDDPHGTSVVVVVIGPSRRLFLAREDCLEANRHRHLHVCESRANTPNRSTSRFTA